MEEENLVKLLTEALKFYAEPANYVNNQIEKDGGHQARHILKMVSDNQATIEKYEKIFDEFVKSEEEEITPEQIHDFIKELKNNIKE